jgi:CheY-like chemotaxis protein
MSVDGVAGRRILVVEDEPMLAIELEGLLQEFGCAVVGPVSSLVKALQLARDESFDAAILDVVIRGGDVYPVADLLDARGIPFVLASGYSEWSLPERHRHHPRLLKPFTRRNLAEALMLLLGHIPAP